MALHDEMNPKNVSSDMADYRCPTQFMHSVLYKAFTSGNLEEHREAQKSIRDIQMQVGKNMHFLSQLQVMAPLAEKASVEISQHDIQLLMDMVAGIGYVCSEVDGLLSMSDLHAAEKMREYKIMDTAHSLR